MLEPLYFALGVVNSISLTLIFVLRGKRLELVQRFGWLYFLLAIPAIVALYDWILRIPFRERPDWRLLTPYVALYLSSNYGFVVMT